MSEVEAAAPRIPDGTITARPATDNANPEDPDRGRGGVAPVKPEYIIPTARNEIRNEDDDDADDRAEGSTSTGNRSGRRDDRDAKRRKKNKGQNKNRPLPAVRDVGVRICRTWEKTGVCTREGCRYAHDWIDYFDSKPVDLPHVLGLVEMEPFVTYAEARLGGDDPIGRRLDMNARCPVQRDLGYCPYGWKCRFLGGHVRRSSAGGEATGSMTASNGTVRQDVHGSVSGWEISCPMSGSEDSLDPWRNEETNWPDLKLLQALRGNTYDFPFSKKYLLAIEPDKPIYLSKNAAPAAKPAPSLSEQADITSGDAMYDEEAAMNAANGSAAAVSAEEAEMNAAGAGAGGVPGVVGGEAEAMDVPLRPEEKKRLNWENGLYLAPLTTVGNLPFRRLCTDLGASITISEMALAQPLISGLDNEWALCRRHRSEKMFGIQLAGGYPNRMVPAAELIAKELGPSGVDFVDINLGCPIDLVFNQGAGSALLDTPGRLGKIVTGMNRALGEIPLTVKFRMGVATGRPNAHKLVPRFATEWGASALTLHGRSRQQRYSKLADWTYIRRCVDRLRESLEEANLPPVPMFGNGDCFSAQQYYADKEAAGVDGVMIARGALIKPWIFTEVKERREWDISATERLEIIKKYADYGLSHWGSDHLGVQNTRRFLCELLSFTHRYVPIGLLERMPPMMNERPPRYRGRNELETLLASENSADWVKISEMFLGKTDESWKFVPKHKSNAAGGEEAQG